MKRSGIVLAAICLSVFIGICAICGGIFFWLIPGYDETYVFTCSLRARGNNLVANLEEGGGMYRSQVVRTTAYSPIKYEVVAGKQTQTLVIRSDERTFYHKGPAIQEVLTSPKDGVVFFIQSESLLPPDARYSNTNSRVWMWSRKEGFHPLTRSFYHLSELELSLHEDSLVVALDLKDENEPRGWLIYSFADKQTKKLFPPANSRSLVMIDNENFLIQDWGYVFRWNASTNHSSPMPIVQIYQDVAAFEGSIWAVRGTSSDSPNFEITKLDKDFKEVGSVIPIQN